MIIIKSPEEIEKIKKLYNSGLSCKYISDNYNFGCGKNTINRILLENGCNLRIPKRKSKYTSEDVDNMKSLYESGKSLHDIALIYDCSTTNILKIFKNNKFDRRTVSEAQQKYSQDDHFFDQIDTEAKSYFFGLLFADGCNLYEKNTIQIGLSDEDSYILEIFKNFLQSDRNLLFVKRAKDHYKDRCVLTVNSKHMCEVLNNYGMVPRKSLIKKFPEVILNSDEEIQRHFIRGYFDGNGSIGISFGIGKVYSDNNILCGSNISFSSTLDMCYNIRNIILNHDAEVDFKITTFKNIYNLKNTRLHDCFKILNWMYKDSSIYLTRKYEKFLLIKHTLEFRNII